MSKREFLMLSHVYDPKAHGVAGWYASEKCDGCRCFWDAGLTRGMPTASVPWSNTEKDARYMNAPISTGLWSRYGKPIQAPGWWLDKLPPYCLDGELWMGNGRFQELMSTVKRLQPDDRWKEVQYLVFDSPPPGIVLADGEIKNTNFRKVLRGADIWFVSQHGRGYPVPRGNFEQVIEWLSRQPDMHGEHLHVLRQERLPFNTYAAREQVERMLDRVLASGGEGIMLRRPTSYWTPERSWDLLKVKGCQDAEATVVGYTWGRETDLGSKLLGKMGALRCRMDSGRTFELSGFTDEERVMTMINDGEFAEISAEAIGALHPGEVTDNRVHNPRFPIGSRITFAFRELTIEGSPKEARYPRRAE